MATSAWIHLSWTKAAIIAMAIVVCLGQTDNMKTTTCKINTFKFTRTCMYVQVSATQALAVELNRGAVGDTMKCDGGLGRWSKCTDK